MTNIFRKAAVLSFAFGFAASFASAQQNGTAWKDYGGSPDNSHYVTINQITKSNVSRLEVAWTYATGDNDIYNFNPVIVDNVVAPQIQDYRWLPS